jgi:hypothetical protein
MVSSTRSYPALIHSWERFPQERFPQLADSQSPSSVTASYHKASSRALPSMNRNTLHQTLIRAARTEKVAQGVPPGFEARVMAAIHRIEPDESLRRWASILWKAAFSSAGFAAAVCVAAMVFLAEEERPRVGRDLGSLSETINGDGDEIASVLIADLEEGESW